MPKDFYTQPDAPDPVLSDEVVLRLARLHAPQVRAVTGVDETGGEARTYTIDETLILKTQRPQQLRPRTSLEKEVFFLNQLAAVAPDLSVPRVLGHGREPVNGRRDGRVYADDAHARYCHAAGRAGHRPPARGSCVTLGRCCDASTRCQSLHSSPAGCFMGTNRSWTRRYAWGTTSMIWPMIFEQEHLAWPLRSPLWRSGRRPSPRCPAPTERVPLHSNPYLEHVFVYPESGAYAGLIDFGDAYISHPAFDMRRWNRPADREALLAGLYVGGSQSAMTSSRPGGRS